MGDSQKANSIKWYRRLLKLYPARFREEYAGPLERDFQDEIGEAGNAFAFWARVLRDLVISIPREFAREIFLDLRFSVRVYAKRPLVTILAIAALAMAIGATTGVFSIVDALLLRSLPFREPERLAEWSQMGFLQGEYKEWRANQKYAEGIAPYLQIDATVARSDAAVRVKLTETDVEFFKTLGSDTEIGRTFAAGEDEPGHVNEMVISYALWQQFFGGDPRVLGSHVNLNGAPMEIIGVAQPRFDFPTRTAVWTPSIHEFSAIPKTGVFFWHAFARLNPGMTLERANSMMQAALWPGQSSDQRLPRLESMRQQLSGRVTEASFVMMGAAAFVLLIACANIANLLLARVAERRNEMAVRAALGASRARLTQQLITESIALAGIAAIGGIFIAQWTAKIALAAQPVPLGTQDYTIVDWRIVTFAALVTLLTGFLFGVFPAWLSGRMQPASGGMAERSGGRGARGMARLRSTMVAVQVSLTVILLAGAIVLGRGFLRLEGTDLGFRTDHLITLSASVLGTREAEDTRRGNYFRETLERLRAVPGVESAAAIDTLPLMADYFTPTGFFGESDVKFDSGAKAPFALYQWSSPDYFKTMGAKLIAGRDFAATDTPGSEPVAVVSEELARSTGMGKSIIGRKFTAAFFKTTYTVVGIAADVQMMVDDRRRPLVFLPAQQQVPRTMMFVARVHGDPEAYLAPCRDAVQAVDREVALYNVVTLQNRLADVLARPRFYTTGVLFLSGFALLLAIIGIYGVASYSVAQRTHEIGVRLAVGARSSEVRWMILRQGFIPAAIGMAIGIGGAEWLGKFLAHLIDGAKSMDAPTCAMAAGGLALVAMISTWTATRRVARMDPVTILRSE